MDHIPHLITVTQASAIALVCRRTIYDWMKAGKLAYVVLPSGARRIVIDSLLRAPEDVLVRLVGVPRPPPPPVAACPNDPIRVDQAREQLRQRRPAPPPYRPPRLRMAKMREPV